MKERIWLVVAAWAVAIASAVGLLAWLGRSSAWLPVLTFAVCLAIIAGGTWARARAGRWIRQRLTRFDTPNYLEERASRRLPRLWLLLALASLGAFLLMSAVLSAGGGS